MEIESLSDQMTYVREQIKKIRKMQGISQLELSCRADLALTFLVNVESGKKKPSVLTLLRIAKALEVNPREFFPLPEVKQADSTEAADTLHIKEEIIRLVGLLK